MNVRFGKLQATQMRVLRWIEGVLRLDRIKNIDFRGRLRQEGVDAFCEEMIAELEAKVRGDECQ